MTRIFSIRAFLLLMLLQVSFIVYSQPPNPGPDPDIPITGVEWLLLGGGLWGAKKIYDLKNKSDKS